MTAPILLDTCAAIWIADGAKVSREATGALADAFERRVEVFVSPMTAWEIGLLVARGRITLSTPPDRWFSRLVSAPGVAQAMLSPEVLIASSFLPGSPPSDPADRIIAATARDLGARLMTRDAALLGYGASGHLSTIAC